MKRITKQETLPALAVPEVLSVPELAYPARLGKRAVVQVLRKADVKKAALAVGGTALVLSAIGAAGKSLKERRKEKKAQKQSKKPPDGADDTEV